MKYIYLIAVLLFSSACSENEKNAQTKTDETDNSAEVKAYYESKPDFFETKGPTAPPPYLAPL